MSTPAHLRSVNGNYKPHSRRNSVERQVVSNTGCKRHKDTLASRPGIRNIHERGINSNMGMEYGKPGTREKLTNGGVAANRQTLHHTMGCEKKGNHNELIRLNGLSNTKRKMGSNNLQRNDTPPKHLEDFGKVKGKSTNLIPKCIEKDQRKVDEVRNR